MKSGVAVFALALAMILGVSLFMPGCAAKRSAPAADDNFMIDSLDAPSSAAHEDRNNSTARPGISKYDQEMQDYQGEDHSLGTYQP